MFSINPTDSGTLVSGGKDAQVIVWMSDMSQPKDKITLPSKFAVLVKSITDSKGNILVGTAASEIFEIGMDKRPVLVMNVSVKLLALILK